jgi:photosystem II stability/assembly factor-like uncharacterized protein
LFRYGVLLVTLALFAVSPAMAASITGWVTGSVGRIAHTTDGGATPWNSQTSGVTVELTRADAVDASTAWAVGEQGRIVNTTNGGATWVTQTNVVPTLQLNDVLRGVDFIDPNSGWVVGRRTGVSTIGLIARTTNGGSSWTSQTIGTDESLVDVDFQPGSTTGWLVGGQIAGTGSIIRKTTDGNNWSAPVVLPGPISTGILNGVDFVSLQTGWAVGSGGRILKSIDRGATWAAQASGTTADLSAVNFLDAQTGWATSVIGGQILRTTNGGASWSIANVGNFVLRDIAFADANNGWAVGSDISNFPISVSSVVLHSSDGGVSWTAQSTTLPASQQVLSGLAVVSTVPEPGSAVLLLLSAVPLVLAWRRR